VIGDDKIIEQVNKQLNKLIDVIRVTDVTREDFVKLAAAYNIPGFRSERPEEVAPILEKAFAHDGPAIVEFRISEEENVFPMVPAGAGLNEMLRGMA